MPTSISVTRTPEAETGHEAPVSVEAPELEPPTVGMPPSPHDTGGVAPESPEAPLEPPLEPPLPLPLLCDAPPELPDEAPLPAPLLPELPAFAPPPEALLAVGPWPPAFESDGAELLPHAAAASAIDA